MTTEIICEECHCPHIDVSGWELLPDNTVAVECTCANCERHWTEVEDDLVEAMTEERHFVLSVGAAVRIGNLIVPWYVKREGPIELEMSDEELFGAEKVPDTNSGTIVSFDQFKPGEVVEASALDGLVYAMLVFKTDKATDLREAQVLPYNLVRGFCVELSKSLFRLGVEQADTN